MTNGVLQSADCFLLELKESDADSFRARCEFEGRIRGLDFLSDDVTPKFMTDDDEFKQRKNDRNKRFMNCLTKPEECPKEVENFLRNSDFGTNTNHRIFR